MISATPVTAAYYTTPGAHQFVVTAGCDAITLPIAQNGSNITIDLSHIVETACGYASDSAAARQQGLVDQVLLSKSVTGSFDNTTKAITFSAGTESITFVPA
jgi:hypothetical protein